ncbi:dynamin family protein [Methyloglobulus sp.]|uniref:dynamin family protein n=1 Tax=Methyloglobulus sp. TaxID=2518622 RepID=UPI0032B76BDF
MQTLEFTDKLHSYSKWRDHLVSTIKMYHDWRKRYGLDNPNTSNTINHILESLSQDRVTLAFVAEFSRGKTELINSLFFSETGVKLLPSSPGRTTMCPTEIFFDQSGASYIKLLDIESRYEETSFADLKENPSRWKKIYLDVDDPGQMQEAFKQLLATKAVSKEKAQEMGLFNEKEAAELGIVNPESVDIPVWRHAMISFPHPLLKAGLCILDTPGLNALGSEPELTLSMLPNTQAIIFVLAVDTGVTKSDMNIWTHHVLSTSNTNKQGLAVVLNKIDAIWDEFTGETGYEQSIRSQVNKTASILGIPEDLIFPVSAKQALIAKLRQDEKMLSQSRIGPLEHYLSENILNQRQKILLDAVLRDIGFLLKESYTLTEINFNSHNKQMEEFRKLDFENQDTIEKLSRDTKFQENAYFKNIKHFTERREIFREKMSALMEVLDPATFDEAIMAHKVLIDRSLTTYGMKQGIKKLFEEYRQLLGKCADRADDAKDFIVEMHTQFDTEYGLKELKPSVFEIRDSLAQLDELLVIGEEFRTSARAIMTEKTLVSRKLFSTMISQSRKVTYKTYMEAVNWGENVLSPLAHQLIDQKKQIENRLNFLRSIGESKMKLTENMAKLEAELAELKTQRKELNVIIQNMQKATAV